MSRSYYSIAFTEPVRNAQAQYGSRAAVDRADRHLSGPGHPVAGAAGGARPRTPRLTGPVDSIS
ncbi:hypothetical protein ABZX30_19305 [Streptomyces sp. NPDC004542]|uniref:hypothetical protein n=1 Tax=Streptomyces sp. NPDC004542 TaxID=3154281 RepID=UPI0033A1CE8A